MDCADLNDRETIYKLITSVKEPYCVYAGDDDYLLTSSLRHCAKFLSENPKYRTAQGRGIIFSIEHDSVYGDITSCSNYWGAPSAENDNPLKRLQDYSKRYWVPLFSLHRTDEFIEDWKPFCDLPDRSFGELAPNFMTIVKGMSKFIDHLHVVRQVHRRRYYLPNAMDWVTSPHWYPSYRAFEETLALTLSASQELEYNLAKEAIRDIFNGYLTRQFCKPRLNREGKKCAPKEQIKKILPTPILEAVKSIKAILSPDRNLSLHGLLNTKSPYYDDFALVLKSIRSLKSSQPLRK